MAKDVMEPAEIHFRQIRMSNLTSVRMQMQIYSVNYLQTVFTKQ